MVQFCLAIRVVVPAGEQVHRPVVVHGAEHAVEVDDPVEEVPGNVALQGAQEGIDAHHVAAGGPVDVGEVLIPAEVELAKLIAAVAELVRFVRLAGDVGVRGGHRLFLRYATAYAVWQISAQRYWVSAPST